eukprot:Skav232856  [mRNA]  locus=scaffold2451:21985:25866:+ [translate_table: standard]
MGRRRKREEGRLFLRSVFGWKAIACFRLLVTRANSPKHRGRRQQIQPDLYLEFLSHFETLEAGNTLTGPQLIQELHDDVQTTLDERPMVESFDLAAIPSLCQIEQMCHKQHPGRAAGPDCILPDVAHQAPDIIAGPLHNLILKSYLQGQEPIAAKGGILQPIWKGKTALHEAQGYRGILLSNCFSKVAHAWTREQLLQTYTRVAREGQLGGLRERQTIVAAHSLRLFTRLAKQARISTAVIFLDLTSAFHHMYREWAFVLRSYVTEDDLRAIILENDAIDIPQLLRHLRQAAQDNPVNLPSALRYLVHSLHQQSWFRLAPADDHEQPDTTSRTKRGSRPGSPLADVTFNIVMSQIMARIEDSLIQLPTYTAGRDKLSAVAPNLAWVDDLAVPLCAPTAAEMMPLVQQALSIIHTAFTSFGFTLNFGKGKSEIVVMYRGDGANTHRLNTFDVPHHPTVTFSTEAVIQTLRVVPSYKHLGIRYSMDADTDPEIRVRVGQGRSAFQELKKPIFTNRAIPSDVRQQLCHSLVTTRVLYGAACWSNLSDAQFSRLDAHLAQCQRTIEGDGFWCPNGATPTKQLRARKGLPDFRLLHRRLRLTLLKTIAAGRDPFYNQLLLAEYQLQTSWLRDVQDDVAWLSSLVTLPFTLPSTPTWPWEDLLTAISQISSWKAMVKRATTKHLLQEQIADEVCMHHMDIIGAIHQGDPTPPPMVNLFKTTEPAPLDFPCPECEQSFESARSLWMHRYQRHNHRAEEPQFVQSTICGGCLRNFRTTHRVQQHLRYKQNGCMARLRLTKKPDTPAKIGLPAHMAGVKRLPCTRTHHGPLRPTPTQHRRALLLRDRWLLTSGPQPVPTPEQQDLVAPLLHRWRLWLTAPVLAPTSSPSSLADQMLQDLMDLDIQPWILETLLWQWRYHSLPAWGGTCDAAILRELDELLGQLPYFLDKFNLLQIDKALDDDEIDEEADMAPQPVCHRSPKTCHFTQTSAFAQLETWEADLKGYPTTWTPTISSPVQIDLTIVLHMFSGRRRRLDFHDWVQHMYGDCTPYLCIVSLDLAIDDAMDIYQMKVWQSVLAAAASGAIRALLVGPPCESWSSARYHQLEDGKGPRPVRDSARPWGKALLGYKELQQGRIGSSLLLHALHVWCLVAIHGGRHPAWSGEPTHASIWRTSLLHLIVEVYGLGRTYTFPQFLLGAGGCKPTTLLYQNFNLPGSIATHLRHDLPRPGTALIGRARNGTFRTMVAIEYPPLMCQALAAMLCADLTAVPATGAADEWGHLFKAFASQSAQISGRTIRPDYQPQ